MDLTALKEGLDSKIKRGDIVSVNLGNPKTNEIQGHEQGNCRPCFVVKALTLLKLAIVLPITTTKPTNPLYTTVKLNKGTANLDEDSYVLCHQIRTISFDRVKSGGIGTLTKSDIGKIETVLLDFIEFD